MPSRGILAEYSYRFRRSFPVRPRASRTAPGDCRPGRRSRPGRRAPAREVERVVKDSRRDGVGDLAPLDAVEWVVDRVAQHGVAASHPRRRSQLVALIRRRLAQAPSRSAQPRYAIGRPLQHPPTPSYGIVQAQSCASLPRSSRSPLVSDFTALTACSVDSSCSTSKPGRASWLLRHARVIILLSKSYDWLDDGVCCQLTESRRSRLS